MRAVPDALWPLAPRTLATRRMVGPVGGGGGSGVGLGAGAAVGAGVGTGADGMPGDDPPPPQAASISERPAAPTRRKTVFAISRINAGAQPDIPRRAGASRGGPAGTAPRIARWGGVGRTMNK